MKKTIYFDELCGYTVSAVTENGLLTEFNFEKDDDRPIKGNVYKGKVVKVLQGLQAAFIDCGLERNCYLSDDDTVSEKYDGSGESARFPDLKEGDDVLVQIVKPPVGQKGAKVTLFPSFVGKNVIYLPKTPFIGVSRKIGDDELRKNLAYSVRNMIAAGEGIVLRTAAAYALRDKLEHELESLKNIYRSVLGKFETAETGEVLYSEIGLITRVLRDILSSDIEEIIVSTPALKDGIDTFYSLFPPAKRRPVTVRKTVRDMFDEHGLSEQVRAVTSPRAELENGAYLVIDRCEALTVIDVNTGCFTGGDNLEQTVYYTNVLAAREIARQVKLRNIGGIVVVDFIDMSNETHVQTVVKELESSLKAYGSKCCVGAMSQFGLVEFTRKREDLCGLELLTGTCPRCKSGKIKSPKFALVEARAKLLNLYAEGQRRILMDVGADTLNLLTGWTELVDDLKERMPDLQLYAAPHRTYSDEQVRLRYNRFDLDAKTVKIY